MLLGQQPLLAWPGSLCGSVQHFFMQTWVAFADFESFVAGQFQLMLRPMKVAEASLQSRDLSLPLIGSHALTRLRLPCNISLSVDHS